MVQDSKQDLPPYHNRIYKIALCGYYHDSIPGYYKELHEDKKGRP
jgi:hypothetical protein